MDLASAKMIGAGLACIALVGAGVGIGNIFAALVNSIARNPASQNQITTPALLGFALLSKHFEASRVQSTNHVLEFSNLIAGRACCGKARVGRKKS